MSESSTSTSDSPGTDSTDADEYPDRVVVSARGGGFHRMADDADEDNPDFACETKVREDRAERLQVWDSEQAVAWKKPCGYPECFGGDSQQRKAVENRKEKPTLVQMAELKERWDVDGETNGDSQ